MATEKKGDQSENPLRQDDDTDTGSSPPVPPDGGWGWVIMFASFVINVLVDGVCFTFGLFYIEFLDYFRESKGKTSWAGSVLNGMYLSFGPITSALCNKYGCRTITIIGSILAGLSFTVATFSPNMDIVILTYGAMGGAGFGLMYLPAIVMVGFYFEKRRALATGFAVCGSGIGAFVFAPLMKVLMEEYGWKGALLITGAITFNGVVCGMLFRPLEAKTSSGKKNVTRCNTANREAADSQCVMTRSSTEQFAEPKSMRRTRCDSDDPKALLYEKLKLEQNGGQGTDGKSDVQLMVRSQHNLCPPGASPDGADLRHCVLSLSVDVIWAKNSKNNPSISMRQRRGPADVSRPMYRKDVFYSGSITHLPEYQSNKSADDYSRSVTSIPRDVTDAKSGKQGLCACVKDVIGNMFDFSLLSHPVFLIYGLSCFLCMAGFFIPFIYLPDNAKELGIDKERAAFLLSILGITNTAGRVLCGWVSDQSWADCLLINNMALIIGGAATILCPFCKSYALLCVYASVFGLCIAVFVSLRSIIMVELMGLEKLTNAFGLVTMCQGLSAFIGAPIAGSLFDATGDYNISFYAAGGTIAMAGIICLPLRRVAQCYQRREERLSSTRVQGKKNIYKLVDEPNGKPEHV